MHQKFCSSICHNLILLPLFVAHAVSFAQSTDSTTAVTSDAKKEFLKGGSFFDERKFDSASVYFERSARSYAQKEDWVGYIRAETWFCRSLLDAGLTDRPRTDLLRILREGTARLGPNHPEVGITGVQMARVFFRAGELDSALQLCNNALALWRSTPPDRYHEEASYACNVAAAACAEKGNYDRAEEFLEHRVRFLKGISVERKTEEEGDIYFYFGNLYLRKDEPDVAMEYYRKAEALWNTLGEGKRNSWPMANVYHNLGFCAQKKSDYQGALELYEKSLEIKQKLFPPESDIIGISYNGMGNTYLGMKDFNRALEYSEKALATGIASLGNKHFLVGQRYANIGSVYAERKESDRAIHEYNKALEVLLSSRGPQHPDVATVHHMIGDSYLQQGNHNTALVHYKKGLHSVVPGFADTSMYANPRLDHVLSDPVLLEILVRKGETLSRIASEGSNPLRNFQAALDAYQLSVRLAERIRNDLVARSSKIMLTEKTADIHHYAAEVAVQLFTLTHDPRYKDDAFVLIEKGKAAVLAEALAESQARRFAGIPDSLLAKEKDLRIELTYYDTKVQQQRQQNKEEKDVKMTALEDRRLALWREHEALLEHLETSYGAYNRLRLQEQTGSVAQVRKALDPETCLIEYSLGDTTLLACVISRDSVHVRTIQIDSTFDESLDLFLRSIRKLEPEPYRKSATALYQVLIEPFHRQISPYKRLIIVPDGKLCYASFEALLAPEDERPAERGQGNNFTALPYLVKDFSVSYHYSAGLFLAKALEGRQKKGGGFVGFAPVFAEGTSIEYRKKSRGDGKRALEPDRAATIGGMRFSDLPSSEEEVLQIARLVENNGKPSVSYLREEANEENFKTVSSTGFEYLHIATHGILNEESPSLSGLAFFPPGDSTSREDGILFAEESYNLELDANLLVLSSCETGLGKLVRGEGVMAMTRGFLYSGARNIVLSLWKVPDESTRSLMVHFYRTILSTSAETFGDALREAKLYLISKSSTSFPKHWAGFVLLGM